ncbi:MAG: DUF4783 domain-containing protein [Crocinitomicaceae bacterium]|nr:DUF4783 domain-containing protein [Crocinitomicaceae bacterium]
MKKLLLVVFVLSGLGALAQPSPPSALEEQEKFQKVGEYTPAPIKEAVTFKTTIVAAFKDGDAETIAKFFAENIDLKILDKENLYSKSQSEHILKDFFENHKPTDFEIVHEGKSGQTDYLIGDLSSGKEKFRVKINTKTTNKVQYITSLSITAS